MLCNFMDRLLCPRDFPGKNTGVGTHSLLQGIFLTQESNPGLPHCRQMHSEPPRKPRCIMAPKEIILLKTCKISPTRYLTSRTQLTFLLPLTAPVAEEGFGSLVIIPQVSPLTLTPPRSRHWFLRTESLLSLSCAPSAKEHITLHYDFVHPCLFPPLACEFPGTYVLFISVSSTHPMANIEWYRISISNISDECMNKWIRLNGQPFP